MGFVEPIMKIYNVVQKNPETRIQEIAEIISDLRDPLISSQQLQQLQQQQLQQQQQEQLQQQQQQQEQDRLNQTMEEMSEMEREEERKRAEVETKRNEEALRKKRVSGKPFMQYEGTTAPLADEPCFIEITVFVEVVTFLAPREKS